MIRLLCGASLMALAVTASAADEGSAEGAPGEIQESREIVVQGDIGPDYPDGIVVV